jgi:aromatic-L-amino-acid/L-tryptophan decarboxylase
MAEENKMLGDMSPEEFRKIGHQLIDWTADYLQNIENFPVLPSVTPGEIKNVLPKIPPKNGERFDNIIEDLNKIIIPGVTHWNHPNFMAYFNSTSSGPGILGELLSATFNTNGMLWKTSPANTELEIVIVDWFRQMLGLNNNFFGIVYDTASTSSFHAIAAAREYASLNVRDKGLAGRKKLSKLILYASEHSHSSIEKDAIALGIGKENVRMIPVDTKFRMNAEILKKTIKEDKKRGFSPFCVVATIGTTSTTSVDPVPEIVKICKKENVWLHVDSAYAGVTAMLPEMKKFFKDIDKADSFVVNPHKWLFTPVDFSVLYTRKPEVLKQAFSLTPEYLKTKEENNTINLMDYGIQLGRRFRALKFWFIIRYFGVEGLQNRLREHIRLAKLFAKWIDENPKFKRLAPVNFGTVCFRAVPRIIKNENELNQLNEKLMNAINQTGKLFISHTKLKEKFTLRIVTSGLRTEERHVKDAYTLICKTLDEMLEK